MNFLVTIKNAFIAHYENALASPGRALNRLFFWPHGARGNASVGRTNCHSHHPNTNRIGWGAAGGRCPVSPAHTAYDGEMGTISRRNKPGKCPPNRHGDIKSAGGRKYLDTSPGGIPDSCQQASPQPFHRTDPRPHMDVGIPGIDDSGRDIPGP
jgi:hypothetical protein